MFERQSAEAALELSTPSPLFLRFSSGRPPTLYHDTTGVHSYLTLIKRQSDVAANRMDTDPTLDESRDFVEILKNFDRL